MIQDRLKALRSEMAKRGISLYVVPTADFHESEYVGEHFKARKYITGFTGSAGPQSSLCGSRTMDRRQVFCAGGCAA